MSMKGIVIFLTLLSLLGASMEDKKIIEVHVHVPWWGLQKKVDFRGFELVSLPDICYPLNLSKLRNY